MSVKRTAGHFKEVDSKWIIHSDHAMRTETLLKYVRKSSDNGEMLIIRNSGLFVSNSLKNADDEIFETSTYQMDKIQHQYKMKQTCLSNESLGSFNHLVSILGSDQFEHKLEEINQRQQNQMYWRKKISMQKYATDAVLASFKCNTMHSLYCGHTTNYTITDTDFDHLPRTHGITRLIAENLPESEDIPGYTSNFVEICSMYKITPWRSPIFQSCQLEAVSDGAYLFLFINQKDNSKFIDYYESIAGKVCYYTISLS